MDWKNLPWLEVARAVVARLQRTECDEALLSTLATLRARPIWTLPSATVVCLNLLSPVGCRASIVRAIHDAFLSRTSGKVARKFSKGAESRLSRQEGFEALLR
eukprot:scaffold3649_cov30-Tisochrysis_lutea.AAC.2